MALEVQTLEEEHQYAGICNQGRERICLGSSLCKSLLSKHEQDKHEHICNSDDDNGLAENPHRLVVLNLTTFA